MCRFTEYDIRHWINFYYNIIIQSAYDFHCYFLLLALKCDTEMSVFSNIIIFTTNIMGFRWHKERENNSVTTFFYCIIFFPFSIVFCSSFLWSKRSVVWSTIISATEFLEKKKMFVYILLCVSECFEYYIFSEMIRMCARFIIYTEPKS